MIEQKSIKNFKKLVANFRALTAKVQKRQPQYEKKLKRD